LRFVAAGRRLDEEACEGRSPHGRLRRTRAPVCHGPGESTRPKRPSNSRYEDRLALPFVPNEEYRKFVQADLTAALALIDLLDAANHKDEFPDFETQYVTISLRVEVAIRHLVTLADAGKLN
jgi:hypothetical protein